MKKIKEIFSFIFSFQFSKLLILFETIMVFVMTYRCLDITYLCIMNGFSGSLPWLVTMISCTWAAYGASTAFYYNKSKGEQLAKIEKFGIELPIVGFDTNNIDDKPTI